MASSHSLGTGCSKSHPSSVSQTKWVLWGCRQQGWGCPLGPRPAVVPGWAELQLLHLAFHHRWQCGTVRAERCLLGKGPHGNVLLMCPVNKAQPPAVTGTLVAPVSLLSMSPLGVNKNGYHWSVCMGFS